MLVAEVMTAPPATIDASATLADVLSLMSRRGVRHLPVLAGERLVGMISDRDLKRAVSSLATAGRAPDTSAILGQTLASRIMTTPVHTIEAGFPLEEAARLMRTHRISALPVTAEGELVGIVTETDLLELIVQATGGDSSTPAGSVVLLVADHRSSVADLILAVQKAGHEVSSAMILTTPVGTRDVLVRVAAASPRPVILALEASGYVVRESWRG
jgi:acetoin utilization protein AcuB